VSGSNEWAAIGSMVLCGIAMGILFDLYRTIASRFHVPRWLLPALDIVYWMASALGVFRVLLHFNQGEVRLYVFLGLGIGVTGYFGLMSHWVIKAANLLISLLIRSAGWLKRLLAAVLLVPVTALIHFLARLLDILFVVTAALLLWVLRLVLYPFRPLGRYIWNRLLPVRKKLAAGTDAARKWAQRWKERWTAAWDALRRK
jgi:spore cortex biosynthesis protein YabQ